MWASQWRYWIGNGWDLLCRRLDEKQTGDSSLNSILYKNIDQNRKEWKTYRCYAIVQKHRRGDHMLHTYYYI